MKLLTLKTMPDTLSDSEIKFWVIEASYGYGCTDYYGAFASKNPVENNLLPDDFFSEASNSLWDSYSWTVLGWNDEDAEGETDEEREAFIDEAYEDFMADVAFEARLADVGETPEEYEIVYDERV